MNLTKKEAATVLHALRIVQCRGAIEGCAAAMCSHFDDVQMMTDSQIDKLCERINFANDALLQTRTAACKIIEVLSVELTKVDAFIAVHKPKANDPNLYDGPKVWSAIHNLRVALARTTEAL